MSCIFWGVEVMQGLLATIISVTIADAHSLGSQLYGSFDGIMNACELFEEVIPLAPCQLFRISKLWKPTPRPIWQSNLRFPFSNYYCLT